MRGVIISTTALTLAAAMAATVVACGPADSSGGAESTVRQPKAPADTPLVAMETSAGRMVIELYPWLAPATVQNFLQYVDDGFYDSLVFHRVKPEFVIQAGGYDLRMLQRQPREMIRNESDNGLSNVRGTIAMARFSPPHSASSQFYINVFDNKPLDHKGVPQGWGYAVFGRVREGLAVVDSISMVTTGVVAGMSDVPLEPIVIDSARVIEE